MSEWGMLCVCVCVCTYLRTSIHYFSILGPEAGYQSLSSQVILVFRLSSVLWC